MQDDYPLLNRLLSNHPKIREQVLPREGHEARRGRCARCEDLLALAEHLAIEGVEKLAANASHANKLENLMAELRMAVLFARRGARVRLLRDNEFGAGYTQGHRAKS